MRRKEGEQMINANEEITGNMLFIWKVGIRNNLMLCICLIMALRSGFRLPSGRRHRRMSFVGVRFRFPEFFACLLGVVSWVERMRDVVEGNGRMAKGHIITMHCSS